MGPPIVVHCSAGVGRTGTYITVDICMHMMDEIEKLNVQVVVELIRMQRANAVQTPEQYLFCHLVLLEYALTKNYIDIDDVSENENHAQRRKSLGII